MGLTNMPFSIFLQQNCHIYQYWFAINDCQSRGRALLATLLTYWLLILLTHGKNILKLCLVLRKLTDISYYSLLGTISKLSLVLFWGNWQTYPIIHPWEIFWKCAWCCFEKIERCFTGQGPLDHWNTEWNSSRASEGWKTKH